jgi:hypothetical protein
MAHQAFNSVSGLVTTLVLIGVCTGEPPAPPERPQVFTGKVVPLPTPTGKPTALVLVADDGTTYALVEEGAARMLFQDSRLQGRPARLTALRMPGTMRLQVVYVQTLKDGTICDVDYWCEVCQISLDCPGPCYCCGDETVFRERPAR